MKNLLTIDIGFFLLSKKQGYRLRRNWESGWGWGDSKEDRREGSCVRCLRRKVFWTATVGKERRRREGLQVREEGREGEREVQGME